MPFLVAHGGGAWALLLLAFVVTSFCVIVLGRTLRARRRARAATRELDRGIRGDQSQVLGTDIEALQAAERGDGSRLVNQPTVPYHSWSAHDILAVLPRITTGRAGVMYGLSWGSGSEDPIGYGFPWRTIGYDAERRTLHDLGGDHAEAARWAEIYARYRAAITDRKVLLSLALWDLE